VYNDGIINQARRTSEPKGRFATVGEVILKRRFEFCLISFDFFYRQSDTKF
jgi:hypothetical protein